MAILEVKNLKKDFGKRLVLKGISLSADLGEIIGLYGPNGSGKTTFLKLIAGLLKPSEGIIKIDGRDVGVYTKSIVSFLPDRNILPLWMSIKDAFHFYKDFFLDFQENKFLDMMNFFNLKEDKKLRELSRGELEKTLLGLGLSRKAKIYLLDEPLGGMDPSTRDKIITTLLRSYREDSLMIISTHLIGEIENIADRTIFISNGEIILDENTENLREKNSKSINDLFKDIF
ncbi:MAG: multidrug ABC transporter ATP-binding protein [Dictyoglomus sp. NZ13-RE01]|nr:MAG: multidrug ABC transporter ATP-binding protein [Dictyoglomus sp. NZ13-RE01]